jgi:opacity protein-like surface antigen
MSFRYSKSCHRTLIVLLLLGGTLGSARAERNLNLVLSYRPLDDEQFWDSARVHSGYGLAFNFTRGFFPLHLEVGLSGSSHGGFLDFDNPRARLREISVGAVGIWRGGHTARPFIGGGWNYVDAKLELQAGLGNPISSDSDSSSGTYLHGGIYWAHDEDGRRFNLGLDYRRVWGTEMEIFGVATDADYQELGVLIGAGW